MNKKTKKQRTIIMPYGIKAGIIYKNGSAFCLRNKYSYKNNPRTQKLQDNRHGFKKVLCLWSVLKDVCHNTFQDIDNSLSPYNKFMSINIQFGKFDGVPPVWISQGALRPINHKLLDSGLIVTDIELGELVIDENTTVGDFSNAVVSNNPDFLFDDELTLVIVKEIAEPLVAIQHYFYFDAEDVRICLNKEDERKMMEMFTDTTLINYDGKLAVNHSSSSSDLSSALTLYHARGRGTGKQKFSSQQLVI